MVDVIQQTDPYKITIIPGTDFEMAVYFEEEETNERVSLAGCTGQGSIRKRPGGGGVQAEFEVTVDEDTDEAWVYLAAADQALVRNKAVYDIKLLSGSRTIGFLFGPVEVVLI